MADRPRSKPQPCDPIGAPRGGQDRCIRRLGHTCADRNKHGFLLIFRQPGNPMKRIGENGPLRESIELPDHPLLARGSQPVGPARAVVAVRLMEENRNVRPAHSRDGHDCQRAERQRSPRPRQARELQNHPLATPHSRIAPEPQQRAHPSALGPFYAIFFQRRAVPRQRLAQKRAVVVHAIGGHFTPPEQRNYRGHAFT